MTVRVNKSFCTLMYWWRGYEAKPWRMIRSSTIFSQTMLTEVAMIDDRGAGSAK